MISSTLRAALALFQFWVLCVGGRPLEADGITLEKAPGKIAARLILQPPSSDVDYLSEGYNKARPCVKDCLVGSFYRPSVASVLDCATNNCLCRPEKLSTARESVYHCAISSCWNTIDGQQARDLVTAYCFERGYTKIANPTHWRDSPTPTSVGADYRVKLNAM